MHSCRFLLGLHVWKEWDMFQRTIFQPDKEEKKENGEIYTKRGK